LDGKYGDFVTAKFAVTPELQKISKSILENIFGLNPLTTDHAIRFLSGLNWFCPFQPPLGVHAQQNNEKTHINFNFLSSADNADERGKHQSFISSDDGRTADGRAKKREIGYTTLVLPNP
jgi:hypothetical protein